MLIGLDGNFAGRCLLGVEDNEINRLVLEHTLMPLDLPFHIAHDGRKGVEAFMLLKPLVVLMDVSLPEMNGYQATQAIREHEAQNGLTRTPIIAMTAHALKEDRQRCLDAGMDDYLAKPISPDAVTLKIRRWLAGEGNDALQM
ncbi:MAG: response regulator [Nitratireductor sp.]|nr:response regulator [Nitratireductor sp.]MCB1455786.1 response regulator [Nitratireductor sp.]